MRHIKYKIVTSGMKGYTKTYEIFKDGKKIHVDGHYDTHWGAKRAAKRWLNQNAYPVSQKPVKQKTSTYTMKFEDK